MSKLSSIILTLIVLAVPGWPLSLTASGQQAPATARLVTGSVPVATSAQFKNAEYYLRTYGKKAKPMAGILVFDPEAKAVRFVAKGKTELEVPNRMITAMLYETTSSPRYVLAVLVSKYFLLTKSTKHFLTIEYKDANGEAQVAMIRLDKQNYENALETAAAATGVRVERIPER